MPPKYVPRVFSYSQPGIDNISVSEAVEYLQRAYKIKVTRLTVYNWINKGSKGIKLQAIVTKGTNPVTLNKNTYATKISWIKTFLSSMGIFPAGQAPTPNE